jgi:hypothetical protein
MKRKQDPRHKLLSKRLMQSASAGNSPFLSHHHQHSGGATVSGVSMHGRPTRKLYSSGTQTRQQAAQHQQPAPLQPTESHLLLPGAEGSSEGDDEAGTPEVLMDDVSLNFDSPLVLPLDLPAHDDDVHRLQANASCSSFLGLDGEDADFGLTQQLVRDLGFHDMDVFAQCTDVAALTAMPLAEQHAADLGASHAHEMCRSYSIDLEGARRSASAGPQGDADSDSSSLSEELFAPQQRYSPETVVPASKQQLMRSTVPFAAVRFGQPSPAQHTVLVRDPRPSSSAGYPQLPQQTYQYERQGLFASTAAAFAHAAAEDAAAAAAAHASYGQTLDTRARSTSASSGMSGSSVGSELLESLEAEDPSSTYLNVY